MKTALEFWLEILLEFKENGKEDWEDVRDATEEAMIEFAKMHVQEALTRVHTKFILPKEYLEYTLSYYPIENIK